MYFWYIWLTYSAGMTKKSLQKCKYKNKQLLYTTNTLHVNNMYIVHYKNCTVCSLHHMWRTYVIQVHYKYNTCSPHICLIPHVCTPNYTFWFGWGEGIIPTFGSILGASSSFLLKRERLVIERWNNKISLDLGLWLTYFLNPKLRSWNRWFHLKDSFSVH